MEQALESGVLLFNRGAYFACHEALEVAWVRECGPRRLFLQSLIHLAVSLYHEERGNREGALRQLRKGLRKLAHYVPACECLDTARLERDMQDLLLRMEGDGTPRPAPRIHLLVD